MNLFSAFKESRGQAHRAPLEYNYVLKMPSFLEQAGPGRASPHATCKALNRYRFFILTVCFMFAAATAQAHKPLVSCVDNGDNTITCQGGFSDGSSASGVIMQIKARDGRVLQRGLMDDNSEFTFDKPRDEFVVLFDAGPEHRLRVPGSRIAQ